VQANLVLVNTRSWWTLTSKLKSLEFNNIYGGNMKNPILTVMLSSALVFGAGTGAFGSRVYRCRNKIALAGQDNSSGGLIVLGCRRRTRSRQPGECPLLV
jgi:hypothetical protein